jgi:DNA-binding NarL/FixJ family response regulator
LGNTWKALGSEVSSERYDRVVERRRAVALARHFRESEGLSTAQIAERLGRAPATVKAYFYDPSKVVKKLYGLNLRSKAWNRFFTCLVHDQMRCCRETR